MPGTRTVEQAADAAPRRSAAQERRAGVESGKGWARASTCKEKKGIQANSLWRNQIPYALDAAKKKKKKKSTRAQHAECHVSRVGFLLLSPLAANYICQRISELIVLYQFLAKESDTQHGEGRAVRTVARLPNDELAHPSVVDGLSL